MHTISIEFSVVHMFCLELFQFLLLSQLVASNMPHPVHHISVQNDMQLYPFRLTNRFKLIHVSLLLNIPKHIRKNPTFSGAKWSIKSIIIRIQSAFHFASIERRKSTFFPGISRHAHQKNGRCHRNTNNAVSNLISRGPRQQEVRVVNKIIEEKTPNVTCSFPTIH